MELWSGWQYKQAFVSAGVAQGAGSSSGKAERAVHLNPRKTYFNPGTDCLHQFEVDDGMKTRPDVWHRQQLQSKEPGKYLFLWSEWTAMPKRAQGTMQLVYVTAHYDKDSKQLEAFALDGEGRLMHCNEHKAAEAAGKPTGTGKASEPGQASSTLSWEGPWRLLGSSLRCSQVHAATGSDSRTELYVTERTSGAVWQLRKGSTPSSSWRSPLEATDLGKDAHLLLAFSGDVPQLVCTDRNSTSVGFTFLTSAQEPTKFGPWQALGGVGGEISALVATQDMTGRFSFFALGGDGKVFWRSQWRNDTFAPFATWKELPSPPGAPVFEAISAGRTMDGRILLHAMERGRLWENSELRDGPDPTMRLLPETGPSFRFNGWKQIGGFGSDDAIAPTRDGLDLLFSRRSDLVAEAPAGAGLPNALQTVCAQFCGNVRNILSTCSQGPSARLLPCLQANNRVTYLSEYDKYDCAYTTIGNLFTPTRDTRRVMELTGYRPMPMGSAANFRDPSQDPDKKGESDLNRIMQSVLTNLDALGPDETFRAPLVEDLKGVRPAWLPPDKPNQDWTEKYFRTWDELVTKLEEAGQEQPDTYFTVVVKWVPTDGNHQSHAFQARLNQQLELEYSDFYFARNNPFISNRNPSISSVQDLLTRLGSPRKPFGFRFLTHPPHHIKQGRQKRFASKPPTVPPFSRDPGAPLGVQAMERSLTSAERFYMPQSKLDVGLDLNGHIKWLRADSSINSASTAAQYGGGRALPSHISILANKVKISGYLDLRSGFVQQPVTLDIECDELVIDKGAEIDVSGCSDPVLKALTTVKKVESKEALGGFDAGNVRIRFRVWRQTSLEPVTPNLPVLRISANGGSPEEGGVWGNGGRVDVVGPNVLGLLPPNAESLLKAAASAPASAASSVPSSSGTVPLTVQPVATYALGDFPRPEMWAPFFDTTPNDLAHAVRMLTVHIARVIAGSVPADAGAVTPPSGNPADGTPAKPVATKTGDPTPAKIARAEVLGNIREAFRGEIDWLDKWAVALGYPAVHQNLELLKEQMRTDDGMDDTWRALTARSAFLDVDVLGKLVASLPGATGASGVTPAATTPAADGGARTETETTATGGPPTASEPVATVGTSAGSSPTATGAASVVNGGPASAVNGGAASPAAAPSARPGFTPRYLFQEILGEQPRGGAKELKEWLNDRRGDIGEAPLFDSVEDDWGEEVAGLVKELQKLPEEVARFKAALGATGKLPANLAKLGIKDFLGVSDGFAVSNAFAIGGSGGSSPGATQVVLRAHPNNPENGARLMEPVLLPRADAAELSALSLDVFSTSDTSGLPKKLVRILEPAAGAVVAVLAARRRRRLGLEKARLINQCRAAVLSAEQQQTVKIAPWTAPPPSAPAHAPDPAAAAGVLRAARQRHDDIPKPPGASAASPTSGGSSTAQTAPPGGLWFVGRLERVERIDARTPVVGTARSAPGPAPAWFRLKFEALEERNHGVNVPEMMDSYIVTFEVPAPEGLPDRDPARALERTIGRYYGFRIRRLTRALPADDVSADVLGRRVSICHYQRACDPKMNLVMRVADPEYDSRDAGPLGEFVAESLTLRSEQDPPQRLRLSDVTVDVTGDSLGFTQPIEAVDSVSGFNAGQGSLHVMKFTNNGTQSKTKEAWAFDVGCAFSGPGNDANQQAVLDAFAAEATTVNVVLSHWDTDRFALATLPHLRPPASSSAASAPAGSAAASAASSASARESVLPTGCGLWVAPMGGITGDTSLNMARQAAAGAAALVLVGETSSDKAPSRIVAALDGRRGVVPVNDVRALRAWLPNNLWVGATARFADPGKSPWSGAEGKQNSGALFAVVTGKLFSTTGKFKMLLPGDASYSFIPATVPGWGADAPAPKDGLTFLEATNRGSPWSILDATSGERLPKTAFFSEAAGGKPGPLLLPAATDIPNGIIPTPPSSGAPVPASKKTSPIPGVVILSNQPNAALATPWSVVKRVYAKAGWRDAAEETSAVKAGNCRTILLL